MRRKIRFNKDADFIFLTYSTVRNIYQTAAILGIPARYVREVLAQREGLFVPARSTRLKVLRLYRNGKSVKQISKELGVSVDWVYKLVERHKSLDRLSDLNIIPHPPFPKEDSFELKKEHRNRLERLREAKVKKYNDTGRKGKTDSRTAPDGIDDQTDKGTAESIGRDNQ